MPPQRQSALITIIITVVALTCLLVATTLVARSLALPRRERVKQLSEFPDHVTALEVPPIDVITQGTGAATSPSDWLWVINRAQYASRSAYRAALYLLGAW